METITIYSTTGQTLYLFPDGQSLSDWGSYRVLLTEDTGANIGRYTASVDTTYGYRWVVFVGATQPSGWNEVLSVAGWDLVFLELLAALKSDADLGTASGGLVANAEAIKLKSDQIGTLNSETRW